MSPLAAVALAAAVAGAAPAGQARPATGATTKAAAREAPSPLGVVDAALARGDDGAAAAWLREQAPRLAADDRFALDVVYVLLGRRRFTEAREQWNDLAPRLQAALAAPAADDAVRRRRVGEAQFVQGLLAARFGTRDEALGLLRDADGNGFPPLESPLMGLAADTLLELDEPTLAAQAYAAFLERVPGAAEARVRRAAALYAAGRLAEADGELQRALRAAPAPAGADYWMGVVRFEQRRMDEASAHLERELRRDPRCAGCLATLAHVAYLAGDDRRCEDLLGRAVAIDPDNLDANLVYGMLYNRTGRADRAIAHLARVVEKAPRHARAQYQLAQAYQRAGDAERAREHREAYERLVREEKAKSVGVRGAED
ncbi:MAG: tetratricopeptide repeat protein [Vicinamibacteria bacterium]